jgi:LAGLIDADG endonuclease
MDLPSYISGFIDGEGCFCVSFQPSRRHRFGWEVRPSFSVSQNADRAELLYVMQKRWKCGFIRPDRSDRTIKYEVREVKNLVERVLPHFRNFPLVSSKQHDVVRFDRICHLMFERSHLSLDGLQQIVLLAIEMNPSGKRKYSGSDILKSLRLGERIVCATGNRGAHEVPTCTNGVTLATLSRPETQ